MKETTLLKIAAICSLVGLIALYLISAKIEIGDYRPSLLNKNVGEDVKLAGTISKITENDEVTFVEINYQTPVTVVLFRSSGENISLQDGDGVEIIGEVQEYRNREEIIARNVRVIKS